MNEPAAPQPLEAAFVHGVVEHMNEDHADAVLNIARAHRSGEKAAGEILSAEMLGLTVSHMLVRVSMAASAQSEEELEIPLAQPITEARDVRPVLIRMARQAREGLGLA